MANGTAYEKSFEALLSLLKGHDSLEAMLAKVASIAVEDVPACDMASVTVLRDDKPSTPVFTDERALRLDEAQYSGSDGPCLTAIRSHGIERSEIEHEERWPRFVALARTLGIRSVLSVPMLTDEHSVGALNLYSKSSAMFSDDDLEQALAVGPQLALGVAGAVAYSGAADLAEQLTTAMSSSAVIEQAKGVLMVRQHCDPDEAFEMMRHASQRENRKVREIAVGIVARAVAGD
jgi:GAF domain-containing protein